jgi:LPXTG-motif cell wall-anchored protein
MGNGPDIGAVEVEDEVIEPVEPITAADTTVQDEMGVPKLVDLSQLVTTPSPTPVLYEVVSVTPGGGATSIQGSVLTFRRALGFTDDVEVVYRVTDDEGQTAEATVTFTLEPTLPETGSDSGLLALFGVLFVAVGGLMLQTSRRPRLRSTI